MKQKFQYSKVAIVGLGQMGGSLAAAIRKRKLAKTVEAFNRSSFARTYAKKKKWVDKAFGELEPCIKDAELIFLCLPIRAIKKLLPKVALMASPKALIIDVGSTKQEVVIFARKTGIKNFIGSHPMAGNEIAGIRGAREDLFVGCWWFVIQNQNPREKNFLIFLDKLGAKVKHISPRDHDRYLALMSHLPHAVAYSLVQVVLGFKRGSLIRFTAGGFRDFTRIASSSPEMWRDIFLTNSKEVVRAIDLTIAKLEQLKKLIIEGSASKLLKFLALGARLRKCL